MSDNVRSLVVALDKIYRDEDIESLISAIRMIKGVLEVKLNTLNDMDHMNAWAAEQSFKRKIIKLLIDDVNGKNKEWPS